MTRRQFLQRSSLGLGALGLASLMQSAGAADGRGMHFAPRAKRVIHLFMEGGVSHVDTFDPKPLLAKYEGRALKEFSPLVTRSHEMGPAFPSPFQFRKHGQSGIDVSEVYPHVARHVDDLCVIRSMSTPTPDHGTAMLMMNCGESRLVRPSLGSWVTYGLGSENENLPAFISMCPKDRPRHGEQNWTSAFLPGIFQGTFINSEYRDIERLIEFIRNPGTPRAEQRRQLDLLHQLEREYRRNRAEDDRMESRIQSFETAFRMQSEATDAFDISKEPQYIRDLYGPGVQAQQMLMARRLIERGVRFVQLWQTGWDHHERVEAGTREKAGESDQGIGALLFDLKQRGLLDDTLVIWAGEFGRTPTTDHNRDRDQSRGRGRDHNNRGFTIWMAGGGVKPGYVYGKTDEFGFAATEGRMEIPDFHATVLHLLGFDHERLTFRHAGRDFRLTDVHGNVVHDIIA